ncbi:IclR family transcriptional regulator [Parasulfitobacter algicola]|uniref:IclR family transcriptional regulator n=1 Tax=Parasulfitobacter algicola TaxID=2614809 RepID=A0ABX2IMK8_9RHOB|nr:IclR family transcriptional regulator [Sulfitobacter algicola]NSX54108.1 IclR family transcriptional regulator [Sulfitobacter algicola]
MTATQSGDGTVGKALDVLDQVAGFGRPVRFGELLDGSSFPKATLYRFVQTLTNQGMLRFDPDRQTYALGVRLVRLAHAAWEQSSLAPLARPHLDVLSGQVGETVHLAQIDNAHVLYVDKRNAADPIEMYSQAGKVGPAYCTGVGKVMLAYLAENELQRILPMQAFHRFTAHTLVDEAALRAELADIRTNGYGFDREEHEPGIICVAVPILTARGRLLGALSVTSSTTRTTLAALESHVPLIKQTARAIAEEAQAWRFPDQMRAQTGG